VKRATCLLLILQAFAACLLLIGCAPTPFRLGEEVSPPPGCIDLRARGGQC
jgi:hypothetical protein